MSYKCTYGRKIECDGCMECKYNENNEIICDCCGQPIVEQYYYIVEHRLYCKTCMDSNYRYYKDWENKKND